MANGADVIVDVVRRAVACKTPTAVLSIVHIVIEGIQLLSGERVHLAALCVGKQPPWS
jgi:hypothetical protein